MRGTQGTETSKYLKEEKEIRFRKQRRANAEQPKPIKFSLLGLRTYHKRRGIVIEEVWKDPPQKVIVLYVKREDFRYDPEYHGTRETLWEAGGTTLQG